MLLVNLYWDFPVGLKKTYIQSTMMIIVESGFIDSGRKFSADGGKQKNKFIYFYLYILFVILVLGI